MLPLPASQSYPLYVGSNPDKEIKKEIIRKQYDVIYL